MKIFPDDEDIVLYATGFGADDPLERKKTGAHLSDLLERLEDPVVIALDDAWGSGKTHFLKRWVGEVTGDAARNATAVYFDAFAHDYLSDPLVSLMATVTARLPEDEASQRDALGNIAARLALPMAKIVLNMVTLGAKEQLDALGDAIADTANTGAQDIFDTLWTAERARMDALQGFKEQLSQIVQRLDGPLVIVVDELDRCRPDYALSVLEIIKHLFAVKQVHFVLGVNGAALQGSVRARYGADIDAEKYLRKFINISFSLPRRVGERGDVEVVRLFCADQIAKRGLPEGFATRCTKILSMVAQGREVSLRDAGAILSRVALLPDEAVSCNYPEGWTDIACVLLVASVLDPAFHSRLVHAAATEEETRAFLSAPPEKTRLRTGSEHNEEFDRDRTLQLATVLYCCGALPYDGHEEISAEFPRDLFDRDFQRAGLGISPKAIPARIQRDWIDLFRL